MPLVPRRFIDQRNRSDAVPRSSQWPLPSITGDLDPITEDQIPVCVGVRGHEPEDAAASLRRPGSPRRQSEPFIKGVERIDGGQRRHLAAGRLGVAPVHRRLIRLTTRPERERVWRRSPEPEGILGRTRLQRIDQRGAALSVPRQELVAAGRPFEIALQPFWSPAPGRSSPPSGARRRCDAAATRHPSPGTPALARRAAPARQLARASHRHRGSVRCADRRPWAEVSHHRPVRSPKLTPNEGRPKMDPGRLRPAARTRPGC